jgi:hypothetical protein
MAKPCWSYAPEKMEVPVGERQAMMASIQHGLREDSIEVPMAKLCRWFGVVRQTTYYKPQKAPPKLQERFVAPVKALIEQEPRFVTGRWRACWA